MMIFHHLRPLEDKYRCASEVAVCYFIQRPIVGLLLQATFALTLIQDTCDSFPPKRWRLLLLPSRSQSPLMNLLLVMLRPKLGNSLGITKKPSALSVSAPASASSTFPLISNIHALSNLIAPASTPACPSLSRQSLIHSRCI